MRDVRDYASLVDSTSMSHLDIDLNEINDNRELKRLIERIQDLPARAQR